jgi:hypothetical protein
MLLRVEVVYILTINYNIVMLRGSRVTAQFVSSFLALTDKGLGYAATIILERRSCALGRCKDLKSKVLDFEVCRHRGDDRTQ